VKGAGRSTKGAILGFLLVTALLGFIAAFYLTLVHYRGGIPRCYVVQGCDIVQTSKYSAVLGVPIALPGTIYFALMFYLGIALCVVANRAVVLTYKTLAYAGALAAIPLFLLQAAVLRAYCTYCLATEIVLVSTWLASLVLKTPARASGKTPSPTSPPEGSGGGAQIPAEPIATHAVVE
jgi:uncharacterized membrane protein